MARNRQVTIVMYHYVRDLERSRYPRIKGLSLDRFRRQLDFIQSRYAPITVDDLLRALASPEAPLPPNAILLTFDDGYRDHFENVFPLLDARRIQGCFFPPAQAVLEHRLLDVNKIHFILASVADPRALLDQVFALAGEFRAEGALPTREQALAAGTDGRRFDLPEVAALKRLLQWELPERARTQIVQRLFAEHVSADETAFACELYMSPDQIACLARHGMHIGSHGYSHAWLNHLTPEAQTTEVERGLDFLQGFGVGRDRWTICYPFGGCDESLLRIIRARHGQLGFGVEPRVADLDTDDRLLLPRVDTNDLPS
jgi:peptidoglycan/xylan/chitin deacetylase (PgdA/CDA1 family)